jgi:hypothetical protein
MKDESNHSFLEGLTAGTLIGYVLGVATMILCQILNNAL